MIKDSYYTYVPAAMTVLPKQCSYSYLQTNNSYSLTIQAIYCHHTKMCLHGYLQLIP